MHSDKKIKLLNRICPMEVTWESGSFAASSWVFVGWEVADWYAAPGEESGYKPSYRRTNWFQPVGRECRAVLEKVGVIDLSAFGKFDVSGPDAAAFVDYIYANEVPKV